MARPAVSLMRPKGVTEPGSTPRTSISRSGFAEGQPPRADAGGSRLQIDLGVLEADDQIDRALVVLQEQVLAMAAGNFAAQRARLVDGEDRRMIDRPGRDSQRVKARKKIIAGGRHRGSSRWWRRMREVPIAFGQWLRNKTRHLAGASRHQDAGVAQG